MALPALLGGSRRGLLLRLLANGVAQAGVAVATALLVRHGFDAQLPAQDAQAGGILRLALALAGIIAVTAWLRCRATVDAERMGQSYVHALRMRLFRHVMRVGGDALRGIGRGALMLRFASDLSATRNWVSLGLARLAVSGLSIVLALLALLFVDAAIALSVGSAVLVAALLVAAIGPRLQRLTREVRSSRGGIASLINDRVASLGVIEAFGQQPRETARVRRASRALRDAQVERSATVGLLRGLAEASGVAASACALVVGSLQLAAGQASPGSVVAAMAVAGLLAQKLGELSRCYEYWSAAGIAREKQLQLLAIEAPRGSGGRRRITRSAARKGLELRGVGVKPLFADVDLAIGSISRVAVIGPNGSGKSTFLRLLAGIVEPDAGSVLFGGHDLREYRRSQLRGQFALVAPDLPLLRGSLRMNLLYGVAAGEDADLATVVEACGLQPLVQRLPGGLEARLSERGEGLSSGERARIAIARALLARPRVLLLDEADANLDRASREALDRIIGLFAGSIVFVTHDPERARRADVLLIVGEGRVRRVAADDVDATIAALLPPDQPGVRLVAAR